MSLIRLDSNYIILSGRGNSQYSDDFIMDGLLKPENRDNLLNTVTYVEEQNAIREFYQRPAYDGFGGFLDRPALLLLKGGDEMVFCQVQMAFRPEGQDSVYFNDGLYAILKCLPTFRDPIGGGGREWNTVEDFQEGGVLLDSEEATYKKIFEK